jgi:O-antigen/teichoic acid export membrane protein
MWDTDTRWFDVAIIMSIFAVGGAIFGRFEMHKPAWRRVLKQVLFVGAMIAIADGLGRVWAYGCLGLVLGAVVVIHGWWLPKHGINGLTAEPYDEYLALVTRSPRR